ncbi:hypothetical protein FGO68_gene1401 [Halteria grandinella]|uniref:Uncharacterized protein n=1 Tax=Halteria grandinella TaxID=5974 RepID=A0A8J8NS44_HALGN|nr:hypothetical protein FGO68_gene1401 [Halteria grandinella]
MVIMTSVREADMAAGDDMYKATLKSGLFSLKKALNFLSSSMKQTSSNQMHGCPILTLIHTATPLSDAIQSVDSTLIAVSHILLTETLFGAAAVYRLYQLEQVNSTSIFEKEFNHTLTNLKLSVKQRLEEKSAASLIEGAKFTKMIWEENQGHSVEELTYDYRDVFSDLYPQFETFVLISTDPNDYSKSYSYVGAKQPCTQIRTKDYNPASTNLVILVCFSSYANLHSPGSLSYSELQDAESSTAAILKLQLAYREILVVGTNIQKNQATPDDSAYNLYSQYFYDLSNLGVRGVSLIWYEYPSSAWSSDSFDSIKCRDNSEFTVGNACYTAIADRVILIQNSNRWALYFFLDLSTADLSKSQVQIQ